MHMIRELCEDTFWIGASDYRLVMFENSYRIPDGMAYNSYVILDEKTCLLDGVDDVVAARFRENLLHVLGGRALDYMIINHMEPDHAAQIPWLHDRFPEMKLVGTKKAFDLLRQFHHIDPEPFSIVVTEGATLELGKHILQFVTAPMVHWPEVMVSFDLATGALFSADAFGEFGALGGNLFADEVSWEAAWLFRARRYYTNIVGKYGANMQNLLKKAAQLPISLICPLHGHVWRHDLDLILDAYQKWSTYTPEEKTIVMYCGSIYGGTEQATEILAQQLSQRGVRNIHIYNAATADMATMVSEAFRASHLVFASSTHDLDMFSAIRDLIAELRLHALQKRHVALIENGSWAPRAAALMTEQFAKMKDIELLQPTVSVRSSVDEKTVEQLDLLADALARSLDETSIRMA